MTEVKFPKLKVPLDTRHMAEHVRLLYINYDMIHRLLYDWDTANADSQLTMLHDAAINLAELGKFIEHNLDGADMFDPPLDGKDDFIFGEI